MRIAFFATIALLLSFVGCVARLAPPEADESRAESTREDDTTAAVDDLRGMIERVLRVSGRLRTAGAELCGDEVAPLLGIDVEQRIPAPDPPHFRDAYLRTFGVEEKVTVTIVDPGSPADRAGVQSGDWILAVNGRGVRRKLDVFEILRDEPGRPPRLEIRRGEESLEVEIGRLPACAHEVSVKWTQEITSGEKRRDHAWISVGMLRFVESDDELAVVIGHELAHRILGGGYRSKGELRADRIGLLLAARAGYDETVAPAFWERFALEKPWMIRWEPESKRAKEPRHARVAERLLAMRSYLAEIARLRSEGYLRR